MIKSQQFLNLPFTCCGWKAEIGQRKVIQEPSRFKYHASRLTEGCYDA